MHFLTFTKQDVFWGLQLCFYFQQVRQCRGSLLWQQVELALWFCWQFSCASGDKVVHIISSVLLPCSYICVWHWFNHCVHVPCKTFLSNNYFLLQKTSAERLIFSGTESWNTLWFRISDQQIIPSIVRRCAGNLDWPKYNYFAGQPWLWWETYCWSAAHEKCFVLCGYFRNVFMSKNSIGLIKLNKSSCKPQCRKPIRTTVCDQQAETTFLFQPLQAILALCHLVFSGRAISQLSTLLWKKIRGMMRYDVTF